MQRNSRSLNSANKEKQKCHSFDTPKIMQVRDYLKSCARKNRIWSTRSTRPNLQSVKGSFDEVCAILLEEFISSEIDSIVQFQTDRQIVKAGETVTNKKSSGLSRIKGNTKWERLKICTAQKMKFSIEDFFSKCNQIRSKLRIWSHLLKKS